ncbi:MAG TPA: hypothetical protein EYN89_13855 [Flavobacteriales bacterium]|nr:hypothetical protein [Flavobacteriales bacterium]
MNKIFTLNEYNWLLKKEQELLISSTSVNHEGEHVPSKERIKNILDFSKAYSCKKSKIAGYLETVLN